MRRREFLIGVGASVCPLRPAIAQANRIRQVGVLMGSLKDDPEEQTEFTAFRDRLASLGWREVINIRFDPVWGGSADELTFWGREPSSLCSRSHPSEGYAGQPCSERHSRFPSCS